MTEIDPTRGVFETLLVASGRPVRLDDHLGRMAKSLRDLYAADLPETLPDDATAAARDLDLGRMRIDVTPTPNGALTAEITVSPIDPAIFFPDRAHGADLRPVRPPSWPGAHKLVDRDWLEGVERELGDLVPLILDGDDVLEAGRASIFIVRDETLLTPPLDGRILPGTGRAATLALAKELSIPAEESPLTLPDLRTADEVFLTSSLRGIRPARSLDRAPLNQRGDLSPRLARTLRARWLGGDQPQ
jgi:para-aminobenzoate synthetase/4-amino-4-deoxychorismate lyase